MSQVGCHQLGASGGRDVGAVSNMPYLHRSTRWLHRGALPVDLGGAILSQLLGGCARSFFGSISDRRCGREVWTSVLMGCFGAVWHRINWVAVPPWHRCNEGCIGMHMGPMCLRAHRAQAQLSIPGVLVLCARTWSEWLRILGQIPPGQTPGEYCTLHGLPPHFSLIHL